MKAHKKEASITELNANGEMTTIEPLPFTPNQWAVNELKLFTSKIEEKMRDNNSPFAKTQANFEKKQTGIASDIYNFARARNENNDLPTFTTDILTRLLHGLPLTAIEDKESEWLIDEKFPDEETQYHVRRPSLWRKKIGEDKDGSPIYNYSDNKRVVAVDSQGKFHMGLVTELLDEIEPIQFPYLPSTQPIIVFAESFSYETIKETDDKLKYSKLKPDAYGFFSYLLPNGRVKKLDKYFAKGTEGKFEEITYTRYIEMRNEFNEYVENKLKEVKSDG